MQQSGKLPVLNLPRPKISIFVSQGRLVAPIHGKFGTTKCHVGPFSHTKFHANQFTGVGTRPQNIKNLHFDKESPRRGEPLDRFLKKFTGFLHAQLYYTSISNLT